MNARMMPRNLMILVLLGLLLAGSAAMAQDTAEAAPAEEEVSVLEGMVADQEGVPVPAASVLAVSGEARPRRRPRGPLSMIGGGDGKEYSIATADTDETGHFRVEVTGPVPFRLRATAPGFASAQVSDVHPGDLVTIVLGPGWTLHGQVIDLQTGRPIPEAEVEVHPTVTDGFYDSGDPDRLRRTVTTDDEGWFAVPDLEANFYRVTSILPGYTVNAIDQLGIGLDGREPRPVHLYLQPGISVTGRVVDAEGAAIEGATVNIGPGGGIPPNLEAWMRARDLSEKTDEEGRFEILGVPRAPVYELTAYHEDFAPTWEGDIRVEAGRRSSPQTVTLHEGTTLTGRLLVDPETPFAGKASASLRFEGGTGPDQGRRSITRRDDDVTLENGVFTARRIPPGKADLTLSANGYADIEQEGLVFKAGTAHDLGTLMMDPGLGIEGQVLDSKGKPIAEASVRASAFYTGGFSQEEATTDEKGLFRIGGLGRDQAYSVEAKAEGYGPESTADVKPEGDPLEFTLHQAGAVRGRVVTGDPPRPLVGFTVEPHGKSEEGIAMPLRMAGLTSRPERFRDPTGLFLLEDLAPGEYNLKVAAEGFIPAPVEKFEVGAGETVDVGEIYLDRGATLHGLVVTREDGDPLGGAAVSLEQPGMFSANPFGSALRGEGTALTTDPEGRFVLSGLAPGRHTLKVIHESYAPGKSEATIEAGIPPADITIELGPGGAIEGVVLDKSGQPMQEGIIMAMSGVQPDTRSITSPGQYGFYRIEHLAPGTYQVLAMPQPSGRSQDQAALLGGMQMAAAVVKEGETTVKNLPEQTGSVNVRGVVRKGRTPVESRLFWMQLSADGSKAEQFAGALADGSGAYQVRLNGGGEYEVRIQPTETDQMDMMNPGTRLKVSIPDEAEVTRDLVIPDVLLSGMVSDGETGEPLPGARVWALLLDEDGGAPLRDDVVTAGKADEEGRFTIEGVEPGTYQLVFSKAGYGEVPLDPIEVDEDDQMEDLNVSLLPGHPVEVRVVDPEGNPVEGALVIPLEFSMSWVEGSGGESGVDGLATLTDLRDGSHDIGAIARSFAPGVARDVLVGSDGDRSIKIRLREGGALTLSVVDVNDEPVSGAMVRITEVDGPDLTRLIRTSGVFQGKSLATGPEGTLDLAHLEPGRYEVEVRLGSLIAADTVKIRNSRRTELTIALE